MTVVLFDWNGTLVDDRDRAWDAAEATLLVHGADGVPSRSTIAAAWCLPVAAFLVRLGVPAESASAAAARWNEEMGTRPALLRGGAREVLAALRAGGIGVGVVSAAAPSVVVGDLLAFGLAGAIDHLHVGVDDKAAVLATYQDVLYVGDSEADMVAAVTAGVLPVAVTGGYRSVEVLRAAGAAAVLVELDDVLELVAGVLA